MTLIQSHAGTSQHLIRQVDEELERGDALQASEKAWGAAVHAVKSIAERRSMGARQYYASVHRGSLDR